MKIDMRPERLPGRRERDIQFALQPLSLNSKEIVFFLRNNIFVITFQMTQIICVSVIGEQPNQASVCRVA